ncbi:protein-disulfide reductase DsbD family protein [Cupriavidus alkaliphilus]|uniref:protein-disulfide reductase DsbD family protein n=1 Tax=Cupriavidus alkaliphilus TaxID=942866 RepID=UPI00339D872F
MSLFPRLASLLLCLPALALAQPSVVITEHVRAELLAYAPDGVAPGKAVRLGLSIQHQPHWHTYWKNPGDSGLATTLSWKLPDGVRAGDIEWPTPQQLPVGPLMNYGYEGQVLLPVELTIPDGFSARTLDVKLRADWLVCKEICIPESGEFSLEMPADASTASHASLFIAARTRVPHLPMNVRATARVDGEALAIKVDGLLPQVQQQELMFFAETAGVIDHAARIEQGWDGARWVAKVPLSAQRSESPEIMHAVLTVTGQPGGIRVPLAIEGTWSSTASPAPSVPTSALPSTPPSPASLMVTLGLAMLGGLLLNLMPCVFPVLSLKVLGFAQPGQSRRMLAANGLAYAGGVIVSFVVLAGLLLALRAGGEQLGWGFQLQSPEFVALLAVVFTLIGLNLAGAFEFGSVLPKDLATLRARHPVADHALTGMLAVAVASPCTAPFMGVALGAALTLPAAQSLLVFAALGLGMASPYLVASLVPSLARRLPRPGVWMLRFKLLMAFPMFATVVWLLWVLGRQAGIDSAAGLLAILAALAFAAWAIGSPGLGRKGRLGFGAAALLTLGATVMWVWPNLHPSTITAGEAPTESRWQPWSRAAVAKAQAEGQPVFVDFTAAWCVTCQWNKRTTLSDPAVLTDFERRRVLLLRADWTRQDPEITQELSRLGRSGVPVYALYAPSAQSPLVLSEILSVDDVRRALADIPLARASELNSTVSTRSQ